MIDEPMSVHERLFRSWLDNPDDPPLSLNELQDRRKEFWRVMDDNPELYFKVKNIPDNDWFFVMQLVLPDD